MTEMLQCRRCDRWCVLFANIFEFFFVFVRAHIVHLAQFVDLSQSQASLAQIVQLRLTVVLAEVLIGSRTAMVQFVKDHAVFIKLRARLLVL